MRPFNLEQALKGEKVVTRKGTPVRIIHIPENVSYPIMTVSQEGDVCFYKKNGTHGCVNSLDLFMSPKKVTYYVNLFESGQAYHHMSEAEAKLAAAIINPDNRIAVAVPVTIEV